MELTAELIEKNSLSDEQVEAINAFNKDLIATQTKSIEDRFSGEAHKNAENILSGAADRTFEKTGIKRNEGEKVADYIVRASTEFLAGKQSEIDQLKREYEAKVKNAGGHDLDKIKSEYESEKDALLKKYADYDELKAKAEKAEEYGKTLSGLKLQVAFTNVKPNFPETVNEYEAKAKWNDFVKSVQEKYDIELDENNEALYIDKENKYKTGKLSDLVKADSSLSELLKGREQKGIGARQVSKTKVDGIPFAVDLNADTKAISAEIKKYLLDDEKLSLTSKQYSDRFAELLKTIKSKR